ncbi:MAG: hypothetical protein ACYDEY_14485 [Acidimicrobiales bacterium]
MTNIPDWLAALGLIVPALTGLVGYGLAGRNEEARDMRAAERETIARRSALGERLEEQQHAFQRETLLELQDVLQSQMRCAAKGILHDQRTLRSQGTLTLLGPELDEESYNTGVAIRRLRVRVLDSNLRDEIEEFHAFTSTIQASASVISNLPTAKDALARLESQMAELSQRYQAITETLGISLRTELGRSIES